MFHIFQKKSIGMEIADRTIEVVELVKRGKDVRILNLGRVLLEPGIVERGRIKNEEKLRQAVKEVFLKSKPRPITAKELIFGLPESQVYIHIFSQKLDNDSHLKREPYDNGIRQLVLKEAQTSIPLRKDDLAFSYRVLSQDKEELEVLLVAASKEAVKEWQQFFKKLKFKLSFFDVESLAVFRGLFIEPPQSPICLIDIGAVATNIVIFNKAKLSYSRTINIAGNRFTQDIARALKIEIEDAEKQKRRIGLLDPKSQIYSVLTASLGPLRDEIKTLFDYSQTKHNQAKFIEEIVLVGGSSKMKGIANYFRDNFNLPTRVGKSPFLKRKIPLEYVEAIGLALRGLDKKRFHQDPVIRMEVKKRNGFKLFSGLGSGRHKQGKSKKEALISKKTEEDLFSALGDRKQKRKLRSKKIMLAIVLIVGLVCVGLAYWYRSYEKIRKKEEMASQVVQYTKTEVFDLKIPLAVNPAEYSNDRVKGRIIENVIIAAGDYREALAHSRIEVEKELKQGEKLWLEPINKLADTDQEPVTFPLMVRWIVYSEEDANKLFSKEVDKLIKGERNYMLNSIETETISSTDNQNVFYLTGRVTISSD